MFAKFEKYSNVIKFLEEHFTIKKIECFE